MTIGVAESLITHPEFDGEYLASRFVDNFHVWRGYGPGAAALIEELQRGEPWDEVGGRLFGEQGSYGNGAAMRVAPVGVLYHNDVRGLLRVADAQAVVTHTNPLGRHGALLQAAAVATAMRLDAQQGFDPLAFVAEVTLAVDNLQPWFGDAMADVQRLLRLRMEPDEVAETLGTGIEAHLSVPAAIYSFAAHYDSFAQAVLYAVRLGGDTDTIGAMTGAISGAFHGARAIPSNWRRALEDGRRGHSYMCALADRLFEIWFARQAVA